MLGLCYFPSILPKGEPKPMQTQNILTFANRKA